MTKFAARLSEKSRNEALKDFIGKNKDMKPCYCDGAYAPEATKKKCDGKRNPNGLINVDCAACRAHKNLMGIVG